MNAMLTFALAVFLGALIRWCWVQFRPSIQIWQNKCPLVAKFALIGILIGIGILLILLLCISLGLFGENIWELKISIFFDRLLPVFAGSVGGYLLLLWTNSLSYRHLLILALLLFVGVGPDYFSKWLRELGIQEIGNVKFALTTAGITELVPSNFYSHNTPKISEFDQEQLLQLIKQLPESIERDQARIKLLCYSKKMEECNQYKIKLDELESKLKTIKLDNISRAKNDKERETAVEFSVNKIENFKTEEQDLYSEYPYIELARVFLRLALLSKGFGHDHDSREIVDEFIEWINDYKWKINNNEFAAVFVVRAYAILDLILSNDQRYQTDEKLDIKQEYIESLQLLIGKLKKNTVLYEKNMGECYKLSEVSNLDKKNVEITTKADLSIIIIAEILAKNNYLDIVSRSRPKKIRHFTTTISYREKLRNYPLEECFGQLGNIATPNFVALIKANLLDTDASLTCSLFLNDSNRHLGLTVLDCISKWSKALSILEGLQNSDIYSKHAKNLSKQIEKKQEFLVESQVIRDLIPNWSSRSNNEIQAILSQ